MKKPFSIVIAALVIIAAAAGVFSRYGWVGKPHAVTSGKPESPLKMKFTGPGTVDPGWEFTAELNVSTILDNTGLSVTLSIPEEIELISGPVKWSGTLKPNAQKNVLYRLKAVSGGSFTIAARGEIGQMKGEPVKSAAFLTVQSGEPLKKAAQKEHTVDSAGDSLRVAPGKFLKN